MNPVGSDAFTTGDFSSTFQTLDTVPGILVVPNAASRPTGYSASQHGRMVWQADLNCMWVWNQPSGGSGGSWLRSGTCGVLGTARNAGVVSTTAISQATAPTITSVTVMVPGGRPTMIMYSWVFIGNDPAKYATLNIYANSTGLLETRHNGNTFESAYSGSFPYPPDSSTYAIIRPASGSQENVTFTLKIRCQDPAIVGSAQGGGSCFITNTSLTVMEV
jgi:hypothetical protein